jgi:hypothetical protein
MQMHYSMQSELGMSSLIIRQLLGKRKRALTPSHYRAPTSAALGWPRLILFALPPPFSVALFAPNGLLEETGFSWGARGDGLGRPDRPTTNKKREDPSKALSQNHANRKLYIC